MTVLNHDTNQQFNLGDIVRLKSGGPAMTIAQIGKGLVRCFWHGGKKVEEKVLPVQVLEKLIDGEHA